MPPQDQWGRFPDAPSPASTPSPRPRRMFAGSLSVPAKPTGEAHDGDTFRLDDGQNARLYGADAFELNQTGVKGGKTVPLGQDARSYLLPLLPNSIATPTGATTYNRPVMSLDSNSADVGEGLLRNGWGLATPEYLKSDPDRLGAYMEAERLARLNRLGAHGGKFQSPSDFRHKAPDPWAPAEAGKYGNSIAVFPDEPTPFQGLRPEIEQGYMAIAKDPKSTAADLVSYAKSNGFQIDPKVADKFVKDRVSRGVADGVRYETLPQVLTDPGDGTIGAGVRGLADPINMLDEMGGVVDTLGLTSGRENLFNSDRRFGDILYNNIDQNRSILDFDDAKHPYARFGGQLASGLALPGASMDGVGLAAARKVLQEGGSRFAAEEAAKAALRMRSGVAGAVEGGLAGFGSGEGGPVDRLPSAAVGAVTGYALGHGSAALGQTLGPAGRSAIDRIRGRKAADSMLDQAPGVGADEAVSSVPAQHVGARAASEWDVFPDAGDDVAGMANESPISPSIASTRIPDRIDVNARARPMLDPATEMLRFQQAQRLNPTDVLPIPSNVVQSADEAAAIGAGMRPEVKARSEAATLSRRNLPSPVDATRKLPKRGPVDLVTFLRSNGGLRDFRGELRHMGIDNVGRDLDFAKGEQRFGKLVDDENGLGFDDAADLAWREGFFPDHTERPTINEFLDALGDTHRGTRRSFRSDDLNEVDAFNAAREQRHAVERARDRGAPLIEDRGQPVSLSDLDRNAPPVSAYEEWGEQAPDFAGNVRLANLDSPQSIARALSVTDQRVGGFDAARRGRISQAETERLASELGMTPDDLLKRRKGQAFNAEEALAARQILAKSGTELVNMARAIQRLDDPGEEKLAAFRQAWVRHVAIQEQVAGATAEAGRTLAQFRQMADSRLVRDNVLNALSEGGGGKERLKQAADLILENSDSAQRLNRVARQAMKSGWADKFNEFYVNSLLSGPTTHVVNAVSNTMTALAQIPEHAAAAAIGEVRNVASRGKVADRVLFSELGARSVGLVQGVKDGLRQAARTLRTGEGSDFGNKVEAKYQNAIPGKLGTVIRTPTRLLSAADELYKGIARRMELNGLAVRQAGKEGLRGHEAIARAADLVANPTDEMLDKAFDYGRYLTFQRPMGKVGRAAMAISNSTPLLKATVPFVRTPINLLKFAAERSPLAPLVDHWRADIRAGGARRDLALARAAIGSGVGALVASMAAEGKITGNGPADEKAKALMLADGWQPYSIKIGDKYVSYSRLDPLATTLGVAAGMVELQEHMTDKQKDHVAMLVAASVMQNLSSKTWLSGIGDLVEAVDDPGRYAGNWLERLVSSTAVPAGVAQVARTVDPTMREADGVLEAIRARIPGASKSLSPKRDVWGQPIEKEGGIGPDIISPAWQSTRRNDAINNALLSAAVGVPAFRRDGMTADEFGRFREQAGALSYNGVQAVVIDPTWNTMPREDKQDEIDRIVRAARKGTKRGMFGRIDGVPAADPWVGFQDAR